MHIYLVENDKTIDLILSSNHYTPEQDVIICFNYLCYLRLKKEEGGHRFLLTEDLLSSKDYQELHFVSDGFAQNWYKSNRLDLTFYNGISYGEIVETVFSRKYMVSALLKYGEVIRKAVLKWPHADILYYDFSNTQHHVLLYADDKGKFFNKQLLVHEVSIQLKLKTEHLKTPELIPSSYISNIHTDMYRITIKQKLLTAIMRVISIINNIVHFSKKQKGQTYFFVYPNIATILKNISPLFILSGITIKQPLQTLKAILSGISYLDFSQIKYELNSLEKEFLKSLTNNFANSSYAFTFNHIDYSLFYEKIINDIITITIPSLMQYVEKVRKGIRQNNIKTLLLLEEIDEIDKAIIAACRLEGTKSVFLDHGIQGHKHEQRVYDRNKSDIIICSGEYFKNYYMRQPEQKAQCVTLGSPILDQYPVKKRKRISKIKKVLFLTFADNCYARLDRSIYQEKYYAEIFSVFDKLISSGIEIHYRPYAANTQYHYYLLEFFGVDVARINYNKSIPFSKLIYKVDLMVSNVSTCFFEAQAAGVPTIFFEPHFNKDALLPPFNGVHGEEVLRVSTGEELLQLILGNQNNPKYLNDFLDNFLEKYAPLYMGNLDGMASKRIVEFVQQDNSLN